MFSQKQDSDPGLTSKIAVMAVSWWSRKRPLHWTVGQHLGYPEVNCKGPEEINLALAVAEYVKAQVRGANP